MLVPTSTVITFFSSLTAIGDILILVLGIALLREFSHKQTSSIGRWIRAHGLILMFIVALLATFGSLYFSEIAGWTPCKDCWWQRIFMYPQVPLIGLALYKRDRGIVPYILLLSIIGLLIAAAHYGKQVNATLQSAIDPLQPCDTTGVSCAKTQIHFTFGYVTIPMMAFTAFVLNSLTCLFSLRRRV